jgi:hypothetical protein
VPGQTAAHDATVPGSTGQRTDNEDRREVNDMYPGPNDTDWQVAKFQHRQAMAKGQHQQMVASTMTATTAPRSRLVTIRQQFGVALLRAGERLLGAHGVTGAGLNSVTAREPSAVA